MNDSTGAVSHREVWTGEQRAEIIAETDRILADAAFRNSKRCVALFRYLLDRSLAGDDESIKERTLGANVFGRPFDYDTASDPVVRVTANEIRKRMAQWYQESDHHGRVRIRLTAGAYLLTFEFASSGFPSEVKEPRDEVLAPITPAAKLAGVYDASHSALEPDEPSNVGTVRPAGPRRAFLKWWPGIAAIVVAALATVFAVRPFDLFQSKAYLAWKPLLGADSPLTISIADISSTEHLGTPLSLEFTDNKGAGAAAGGSTQDIRTFTPVAYAVVAQNITDWLATHNQKSVLRGASAVKLQELRQGPVVLIGGLNPWSLRLLSKLRYTIHLDSVTHAMWIQDAQNVSAHAWMIEGSEHPKDVDYAVISRFIDSDTGNWVLSFGGLTEQGTEAAKDLLIDSSYDKMLPAQIGPKGNFQIVLKTNIINGCAGPPQILAVHTW